MGQYFLYFFGYLLLANGITSIIAYQHSDGGLGLILGSVLISLGSLLLANAHMMAR